MTFSLFGTDEDVVLEDWPANILVWHLRLLQYMAWISDRPHIKFREHTIDLCITCKITFSDMCQNWTDFFFEFRLNIAWLVRRELAHTHTLALGSLNLLIPLVFSSVACGMKSILCLVRPPKDEQGGTVDLRERIRTRDVQAEKPQY